jgi:hypothetical protein
MTGPGLVSGPPSRTAADRLLLAGLLAAVMLYCLTPIHNGNIFWHLRNGEDILDTGRIRLEDPFTYTAAGNCWVQEEWLAEVLYAAAWRTGGAAAVVLLKGLVVTASVYFAASAARRRGADTGVTVMVAVMWFAVCHARWIARPHVFTLLYFALFLRLMAGMEERPLWKNLLLFLPVQVLWVNTHAGFVMGPFLLFLPVLDGLSRRRLRGTARGLVLPLAALAVSGVHPNGFRSLQYLPSFLSQPIFRESIREWWSPFDPRYQPNHPVSKTAILLMAAMAVTLVVVILCRRRMPLSRMAGLGALGMAGVFAARNIELLALTAVAWVSPLPVRGPRKWLPGLMLVCTFAVALTYGVPREVGPPRHLGLGVDWDIYPADLADFLEEHPALLGFRVFNTNEIAGYLEYRFGERLPLYMDGRCPLYPERLFEEYLLLALADSTRSLEQLRVLQERGVGMALLDWPDPGVSSAWILARLPGWTPVFWDDLTIAYARKDLLDAAGLGGLAMDHVDPLDLGALLTWPLYRIPPCWIPELARASDHPMDLGLAAVLLCAERMQAGDAAGAAAAAGRIVDDSLREDVTAVLAGVDPPGEEAAQLTTLLVWSLARGGRTDDAVIYASGLGDPVLLEALEIRRAYLNGDSTIPGGGIGLPFIPSGMQSLAGSVPVTSPQGRLVLASASMTAGMMDSALVILDGFAAERDSLAPWMLCTEALIRAGAGEDSLASALAGAALAQAVTPFTLETAGRVDWMAGRYAEAAPLFGRLLELSPGYSVAGSFYADCLWRTGDVDGAMREYTALSGSGSGLPPEAASRMDAMEMLLSPGSD